MKALLSVAVVAAMLGGVSLQAATTTKSTRSKKPVVKKKLAATKVIRAKKKNAPKSPWSFGAIIENEYGGDDFVDNGVTTGTSYLYLRANYKINSETSLRIQQQFAQAYEDGERTKATVDDLYFQLAKSNLFKLGKTGVNSYVRAYLPTSIATREQNNQYLELRGELSASVAKAGAFELSLHTHGRYYAAETYQDATPELVGSALALGNGKINKDYRLRNYANMSLNITDKFYFLQQLGVQHTFMKVEDENGNVGGQPNLYAWGEAGYQINPTFGMYVGAYSLKPMNTASAALFNTSDSLYYITGIVSF